MARVRHHASVKRRMEQFVMVPIEQFRTRTPLSFRAKGVWNYLLSHREGWDVSIRQAAKDNGVSPGTIQRGLSELEEAGWLEIVHGDRSEDGRFEASRYVLIVPETSVQNEHWESEEASEPVSKMDTECVQNGHKSVPVLDTLSILEVDQENRFPPKPPQPDLTAGEAEDDGDDLNSPPPHPQSSAAQPRKSLLLNPDEPWEPRPVDPENLPLTEDERSAVKQPRADAVRLVERFEGWLGTPIPRKIRKSLQWQVSRYYGDGVDEAVVIRALQLWRESDTWSVSVLDSFVLKAARPRAQDRARDDTRSGWDELRVGGGGRGQRELGA